MQNILDWGKEKPALSSLIVSAMAMSADALVTVTDKEMRQYCLDAGRLEPARWLKFYFNSTKTYASCLTFLCMPQILLTIEFLEKYQRGVEVGDDPFEVVARLAPMMDKLVVDEVDEKPGHEQAIAPDAEKLRDSLESVFTNFVILTSLVRFQKAPSVLYREATKGNVESLIALLSIDLMVLESARIRAQVYRVFATAKPGVRKRLQRAIAGEGGQSRSAGNVKALLSAFTEVILESIDADVGDACERFSKEKPLNLKMNSADLRRALDAAAFTQRGVLQDNDLPESPEAFQKAVRRARSELESSDTKADKKKF